MSPNDLVPLPMGDPEYRAALQTLAERVNGFAYQGARLDATCDTVKALRGDPELARALLGPRFQPSPAPQPSQVLAPAGTPRQGVPLAVRQLTRLRRRARVSQADLARIIGTQQSAVSEIESGITSPNLNTLNRIAAQFGMECVLTPILAQEDT